MLYSACDDFCAALTCRLPGSSALGLLVAEFISCCFSYSHSSAGVASIVLSAGFVVCVDMACVTGIHLILAAVSEICYVWRPVNKQVCLKTVFL